jgi:hypothetical protein
MPNCDFYGVEEDFDQILDFVFAQPGWVLVELSSAPDQALRTFRSRVELTAVHEVGTAQALFNLHASSMAAPIVERRVTFKPGAVPGALGRTDSAGWGLIQLYLGPTVDGEIRLSHSNHNSRTRALAWESLYLDDLGPVQAWDWNEVERVSSRLNRFIRRIAVDKVGSRVILPGAARTWASGFTLSERT